MDKIIVVQESKKESIIKDSFTFGSMIILLVINHLFLGGRLAIDIFFLGMVVAWLLSKSSPAVEQFASIKEAKAYLTKLEKKQ